MEVILRYWDPVSVKKKTCYSDYQFFELATHLDLLCNFKKVLDPSNSGKIFQISMDGSRVKWKVYKKITKERK